MTLISRLVALAVIIVCSNGICHADAIDREQIVEVDTIHFHDNMKLPNSTSNHDEEIVDDVYDVTFMMPKVSKEVSDNIKAKVSEALGCKEKGDFMKMAQEASQRYFAMHKKEIKKGGKHYEPFPWAYCAVFDFRCISPMFITIGFEADDSRGEAYGTPYSGGWTFLRENGKVLTWKDISSQPDMLLPFIEEGFGDYKEVFMESIKSNNQKLKLPVTNPWIERDDLIFQYQADEIVFRSMGCPRSEVSVKTIGENIVNPLVKELVNSYDAALDFAIREEPEGPDEPETLPLKIMYDTCGKSLKVEGTPCIESFLKAVPSFFSKEHGWFIHPNIDNANGYACYSEEGDGKFEMNAACWKRNDGRLLVIFSYDIAFFNTHKENTEDFCLAGNSKFYYISGNRIGEPTEHRFVDDDTGFAAYLYNPDTKTLEKVCEPPLNGWDINTTNRFLILPQNGKDIKVREGVEFDDAKQYTYHSLKWNGMTFEYIRD